MTKKWPKGLEAPEYYIKIMDGVRESLAEVAAKVNTEEKRVLADKYMSDDEKADRLKEQEIRWQKALNKAKKLAEPVAEYLGRLRQAETWALEIKHPDLQSPKEWQEAVARGDFVKEQVEALVKSGGFDQLIEQYHKAEVKGDDVLAWLTQQHSLNSDQLSAEARADLVTAISEHHPVDRKLIGELRKTRENLAEAYSQVEGEMGMVDEHAIRRDFGLQRGQSA